MSWFPNIPTDKFGTKQKKPRLTKENQQAKKSATRRSHTIKDVRKQRQKTDQYAAKRILDIQNIIDKTAICIDLEQDLKRLAAIATLDDIFDNSFEAICFIKSHKNYLY